MCNDVVTQIMQFMKSVPWTPLISLLQEDGIGKNFLAAMPLFMGFTFGQAKKQMEYKTTNQNKVALSPP